MKNESILTYGALCINCGRLLFNFTCTTHCIVWPTKCRLCGATPLKLIKVDTSYFKDELEVILTKEEMVEILI